MNDKKIKVLLEEAYAATAPESLHTKIKILAQSEKKPLWGGVFLLQPAFLLAVVILLVILSGGTVIASASKPGSPLFPIKKAVVQVQMALSKDENTKHHLQQEVLEPTNTPTPTQAPESVHNKVHFHVQNTGDENEQEGKEVEGASTVLPTQESKSHTHSSHGIDTPSDHHDDGHND